MPPPPPPPALGGIGGILSNRLSSNEVMRSASSTSVGVIAAMIRGCRPARRQLAAQEGLAARSS